MLEKLVLRLSPTGENILEKIKKGKIMTTSVINPQSLIPALFPERSLARDAVLVIGGSLVLAALSQVSIGAPVPMTLQTLGVLLIPLAFGFRLGSLAVAVYLLEGVLGLPVFAGFKSFWTGGAFGVTSGYLLGFMLAALALGWFADKGWTKNILLIVVAMFVATVLIYIPGVLWLEKFFPGHGIDYGLTPFLIADAIKAAIAAVLLPSVWALINRK
jgi:biotin transport system substrate-specific component